MNFKTLGLGLGVFSVALGAVEVGAPGRLAKALGLDEHGTARKIILGYGVRELMAGAALLRGPAVSTNVWNRVFGDAIDIVSLLFALPASDNKRAVAGALAFVGGATALDVYTAVGLDEQTGKTFALDRGQADMAKS
jgi:hypothetical protein